MPDSWVLRCAPGWDRTMRVSSFFVVSPEAASTPHSWVMAKAHGAPANSVHDRFVPTTQTAKHPAIRSAHAPASWLAAEGVPEAAVPRARPGIGVPRTLRLLPPKPFCSEARLRTCQA